MTRPYEVVYIFDAVLEEAPINERLARFHALIQIAGAEEPQVNHWGKRTLAYPIKKHETGYYVVAKFECDTAPTLQERRACNSEVNDIKGEAKDSINLVRDEAVQGCEDLIASCINDCNSLPK